MYKNVFEGSKDPNQTINITNNDITLFEINAHKDEESNKQDNLLEIENSDTESINVVNNDTHFHQHKTKKSSYHLHRCIHFTR